MTSTSTTLAPAHRLYIRCIDCFAVSVVDSTTTDGAGLSCLCGGRLEVMGKVSVDRRTWTRTEEHLECNAPCQFATGPNCSCDCLGANHGAGLVTHTVVADSGIVRVAKTPTAKQLAVGATWRAALAGFDEALASGPYGPTWAAIRKGEWVADASAWRVVEGARKARRTMLKARSQAPRLAVAAEWTTRLSGGAA